MEIRAQAESLHSVSKYGHVETLRTITKDNPEASHDDSHGEDLGQRERNFWLTHDSNKIVFVYRILVGGRGKDTR